MTKKNRFQITLSRREKTRERLRSEIRKLTMQINTTRRSIQRIDQIEDRLMTIHIHLCHFYGMETIRGKGKEGMKQAKMYGDKEKLPVARWIFCKYAIERMGISGDLISDFLGAKMKTYAVRSRKAFTKQFKIKPQYMKEWKEASSFIKKHEHEQETKH